MPVIETLVARACACVARRHPAHGMTTEEQAFRTLVATLEPQCDAWSMDYVQVLDHAHRLLFTEIPKFGGR
jgi:hypothetical protein